MILPAIPKQFYFQTTFGEEWKDFWDRLWKRAQVAIENAHDLAIIGYSLPIADGRARATLLGAANKAVHLSICCANATANLEQEFRDHGFIDIQSGVPTFDDFLINESKWRHERGTTTQQRAIPLLDKLSRLNDLVGKRCFVINRIISMQT
jgi:hypothetical protein